MALLSVNVNKVAVLRNSRGGARPSVCEAAEICLNAGCDGITVHPRPDQRHIRHADVLELAALTRQHGAEFNIEGNPFAAARPGYVGLLALCQEVRPTQVTLVPDQDGQLTSNHGFPPTALDDALRACVQHLHLLGCRVSIFVDVDLAASAWVQLAALGTDRVELYTGPYAEAWASAAPEQQAQALAACVAAAQGAGAAGLGLNAGHDLDLHNLPSLLAAIPSVQEVSIGHALIADALIAGLDHTVRRYKAVLDPTTARQH